MCLVNEESLTQESYACKLEASDYIDIIRIIDSEYTSYCKEWSSKLGYSINLKKKCVNHVFNEQSGLNNEFKEYMDSYIKGLFKLYVGISSKIKRECGTKVIIRGRVKEPLSIINKLNKKNNEQNGSFPIIKCLNDLLGIRIIDINYKENIDEIKMNLNEYKTKHRERNNNDYIGYHVYFQQKSNTYFPIELQIWDVENEQNNINSHRIYKQDYISWEKEYINLERRGE